MTSKEKHQGTQTIKFDCVYSKPIVKYEDKDLFHAICMHLTILASQTELNQFIDGLKLYNASDIIRAFPECGLQEAFHRRFR